MAHEFGHHLQNLLGTERQVRAAQAKNPSLQNQYSIALELQADCYAGAWAKLADQQSSGADQAQRRQHRRGAEGRGRGRRRPDPGEGAGPGDPEGWTHGSAADRQKWFTTGYQQGTIDACNTFK